jgi:hypothetical protein
MLEGQDTAASTESTLADARLASRLWRRATHTITLEDRAALTLGVR